MADLIDRDVLMAQLEDRQAFLVKEWGYRDHYTRGFEEAVDKVGNAPAVDAVEVVRCKNCQYWNPRYETMGMCMKHNSIVTFTKPDFFCAWGKDKNDGICKED